MPELPNPHQLRYLERVGAMRAVPKLKDRCDASLRGPLASADTSRSETLVSTRRSLAERTPATTTVAATGSVGVIGRFLRWCGLGFALGCLIGILQLALKIAGVLALVVLSSILFDAPVAHADEPAFDFDSAQERYHTAVDRRAPDLDILGDPFWESDDFLRPQSFPARSQPLAKDRTVRTSLRFRSPSVQNSSASHRQSSVSFMDQFEAWYWLFVIFVVVVGTWGVSSFLTSQEIWNDERRRIRNLAFPRNPVPPLARTNLHDAYTTTTRLMPRTLSSGSGHEDTDSTPPERATNPVPSPAPASARHKSLPSQWKSCVRSIKGNCRSENQDRGHCFKLGKLEVLVVCDGCGGIPLGGEASAIAVNAAERAFRSIIVKGPAEIGAAVRQSLIAAEAALLAEARALGYSEPSDAIKALQTTMIIVVTHGKHVDVAWLGDGLVLLVDPVRGNQNLLTPHRPDGHTTRLSSCLGPAIKGVPSSVHTTRSANSLVIVSTDGISDRLDSDGLAHSLISLATQLEGNMEAAIESLLNDCANHKSGSMYDFDDNMTLGVLCGESRPALASRRVAPKPVSVEPESNVQDQRMNEHLALPVGVVAYAVEPADAIHRGESADPAIVTSTETPTRKTWLPAVISPPIPTSNTYRLESTLMVDPYPRMDKAT